MIQTQTLDYFIPHEKQGQYLTLPFQMPEDTAAFSLSYHYPTHHEGPENIEGGVFTARQQINIIDLGLIGPEGEQVGASGSNKHAITITPNAATPGYTPHPLTAGEWQILVGAYKVASEGVTVTYELGFEPKQRSLLIGDIHTHTIASDGVLSPHELAVHARRHGLDFLAITDHNTMISGNSLEMISQDTGITLIPGVEWTHFEGHANFLGVDCPYDEPFFTNTAEEAKARFLSARSRGALIIINHPCLENEGFHFDLTDLPFDCLEIWNGPMRESNLRAIGLWQSLLIEGKKIPAVGGSDYHRDNLFQILGGPCMGLYALSITPVDILDALRRGQGYITFAPNGPRLEMTADEGIMGDSLSWHQGQTVQIRAEGLIRGDILRAISAEGSADLFQASSEGHVDLSYPVKSPGFVRLEIHRTFLPGLPPLPALIGNPMYFE